MNQRYWCNSVPMCVGATMAQCAVPLVHQLDGTVLVQLCSVPHMVQMCCTRTAHWFVTNPWTRNAGAILLQCALVQLWSSKQLDQHCASSVLLHFLTQQKAHAPLLLFSPLSLLSLALFAVRSLDRSTLLTFLAFILIVIAIGTHRCGLEKIIVKIQC